MNELPTIPAEPETLETFQKRLEGSELDFLTILSNTFVNSANWLSDIQMLLSDSGDPRQLGLARQRELPSSPVELFAGDN